MRWETVGCKGIVLWGASSRTWSIQHIAFLCTSHLFLFSMCFPSVHVVHLNNSMDTATAWKKFRFILSDRSDIYIYIYIYIYIQLLLKFDANSVVN